MSKCMSLDEIDKILFTNEATKNRQNCSSSNIANQTFSL